MSTEPVGPSGPTLSEMLGGTFRLLREHAGAIVGITGLVLLPCNALYYWAELLVRRSSPPHHRGDLRTLWNPRMLALFAIYMLVSQLAIASVAHLAMEASHEREASLGECLAAPLQILGKLFMLLAAVTGLVLVGMAFCCAPGLIVAAVLAVAVPVCQIERRGVRESLRRSRELTRGSLLPITGASVLMLLVTFAFEAPKRLIHGVPGLPYAIDVFVATASGAVQAAFQGSLYVRLRALKGGGDAEQTAAVFD